MSIFLFIAVLLLALGLLFLLPPLIGSSGKKAGTKPQAAAVMIYRDKFAELERELSSKLITPEEYETGKRELSRRLLDDVPATQASVSHITADRKVAVAVAIALPLIAGLLYLKLGNLAALDSAPFPAPASAVPAAQPASSAQVAALIEQLVAKLKQQPNDKDSWVTLARVYARLGQYPAAGGAYDKAIALAPTDAQLHADYAEVLAKANNRSLDGKPERLIQTALNLDPANLKALALAGTAASDRNNDPLAIEYWERLLNQMPKGSNGERVVAQAIAAAKSRIGNNPVSADGQPQVGRPMSSANAGLTGVVTIIPSLTVKVAATDTLYIFARATESPDMPVAIARTTAGELQKNFVLDDTAAMQPNLKLSGLAEVTLGARISKSGNPTAQSGDLHGFIEHVKPGSQGLRIVIDRVVP